MAVIYYHGTNNGHVILNALTGNGKLNTGFHLTTDKSTALNYGSDLIEIELEADLTKAHVGFINKDSNFNASVGNKLETVLHTPAAINELYFNIVDAKIIH
jgi:hypothetical protein